MFTIILLCIIILVLWRIWKLIKGYLQQIEEGEVSASRHRARESYSDYQKRLVEYKQGQERRSKNWGSFQD